MLTRISPYWLQHRKKKTKRKTVRLDENVNNGQNGVEIDAIVGNITRDKWQRK